MTTRRGFIAQAVAILAGAAVGHEIARSSVMSAPEAPQVPDATFTEWRSHNAIVFTEADFKRIAREMQFRTIEPDRMIMSPALYRRLERELR